MTNGLLISGTISQPRMKTDELKRVKVKPVEIKANCISNLNINMNECLNHENITPDELQITYNNYWSDSDKYMLSFRMKKFIFNLSKKFKVMWKSEKTASEKVVDLIT